MKKAHREDLHVDEFGDSQEKLYTYIDWLYNSNRLTKEEYNKLLESTVDCVMKAISFGSKEVE
jgi:hypothetical protein